ncbi:LmeA family phospholipid-binding protein [Propioniciclava soli]|uniref:LmeA family phospholipid-binding protein n=1 Tax=Propioniciclava soli TaxID=2775081 RepID=A0ABZ3CA93_9ACTN
MKALAWIVGSVLVLGALLVGAVYVFDAPIRERIEAEALREVEGALAVEGGDVSVEGFPIAWYAVRQEFPAMELTAESVPFELATGPVVAHDLTARLTDVALAPDAVRAAGLTGTTRLDYSDLSALAGVEVTHADGDRIRSSGSFRVLGMNLTGTVTAVPVVDAATQTVRLEAPEVDVAGVRIPDQAVAALVDTVWQPVSLDLPYAIDVTAITATQEGLLVDLTGTDVTLPTG